MKRTILISLLAIMTVIASAQDSWNVSDGALLDGKTMVKVNLMGLAMNNYGISVERILNKSFSANLVLSMMPQGKIPYASGLLASEDMLKDLTFGTSALALEGRWYVGSGYGKGFYIAPYYKYEKLGVGNIVASFSGPNNQPETINIGGNLNTHSGGILFGAQWLIGKNKNFVLDWSILGLHYGASSGKFTGRSSFPLSQDMQNDIQKELDDNLGNIPVVKAKATVNTNGVDIDMTGPWAFLRSSLSFGYRF